MLSLRLREGGLALLADGEDAPPEGALHGAVDLFFFELDAAVDPAPRTPPPAPLPPPLLRGLALRRRSPPLLDADRRDELDLALGPAPIDAVPVLTLEVAPEIAGDARIDGELSSGLPTGSPGGWRRRGPDYLRYLLRSLELRLVSLDGAAPPPGAPATTEGLRPYTWRYAPQAGERDGQAVELALLDWRPVDEDALPAEGPALDSAVDRRWGQVCAPVAEAAPVLWTFRASNVGSSSGGWRLVGVPWPDAPGSRRSLPVNLGLRVRETWRTDSFLDGVLPTKPAAVFAGQVHCLERRQPTHPRQPELVELDALTERLGLVSFPAVRAGGASTTCRCVARALEAPYELLSGQIQLEPRRGLSLWALVEALDLRREGQLRDVVRLSGAFVEVRLYVLARIKMVVEGLLVAQALDSGGRVLPDVSVSFTPVELETDLPARWRDPGGPWWEDVALVHRLFAASTGGGLAPFAMRVRLPRGATAVDVGVSPLDAAIQDFQMDAPSWILGVVEGLSEQERWRAEQEQDEADYDLDGLEDALGDRSRALLRPGARYEVALGYDAWIGRRNDETGEIEVRRALLGQEDRRAFVTDAAPPRSLEPRVLAQLPSAGERHHFFDDPVVLVFGTDDVPRLFEACGRSLRALVRPVSSPAPRGGPEEALRRFSIDASLLERLVGVVLSPWEATVRRRLSSLPCADLDPDAARHGRVTLPFALEPATDYVLEIESVLPGGALDPAAPGDHRPLYRRAFSTSRYPSREAMAEAVRAAPVVPRLVTDAEALLALDGAVEDEALDAALRAAGLGIVAPADPPRVSVLWTAAPPPRPVAVLVESPEPLWRTRLEPTPDHAADGAHILRWRLAPRLWLSVVELVSPGASVAPTPPADAMVSRFVRDARGRRTLALLRVGARGGAVRLGLARTLNPLMDGDAADTPPVLSEIALVAAPWEESS